MLDDASSAFRDELSPGERLLWSGRPQQGLMLRGSDALLIPFSLLWGGFAVFWEASAVRGGAPFFFKLWGIPFVLVGLYITVGRFLFDAWQRARTLYAVTDQRALILSGLFTRNVRSLGVKSLSDINFSSGRDGKGTITLGPTNPLGAWNTSWPGMNRHAAPTFEMIDDARRVYELLRQLQLGSA